MIFQLSQNAFLSVALSSIEAYKKECYGLILGYRTDTAWFVEYAVPYQTASRGHKMVTPHGIRDRRVRDCLNRLSPYEYLGTFHSHPAWGNCRALAKPSPHDLASHLPGEIDLIIAVNDAPRGAAQAFRSGDGGRTLRGTVCDFSLTMAAWYKPPILDLGGAAAVRRLPIRCPHALGFAPEGAMK